LDRITEGRIVHYVFTNKHGDLVCRPAIVVNAWNNSLPDDKVNLQVFFDGTNDVDLGRSSWVTSVAYSERPAENSWHWPKH
jgi:hypothetical protein